MPRTAPEPSPPPEPPPDDVPVLAPSASAVAVAARVALVGDLVAHRERRHGQGRRAAGEQHRGQDAEDESEPTHERTSNGRGRGTLALGTRTNPVGGSPPGPPARP